MTHKRRAQKYATGKHYLKDAKNRGPRKPSKITPLPKTERVDPADACARKRRFFDEAAALACVEERMITQLHQDKSTLKLKAYQCPVCPWWHLATVREKK